ncbi:hypothetical protein ACFSQE_07640 [Vogesella fluminis]|uniref:hypothetical protein n=1 Tax=Vogesella fluminis TaxID=1069161 RepID=UPI00362B864C
MTTDIKITPDQHYTRSEIIQIGEEAKPVLFRFKKSTLRKLLLEKKFPRQSTQTQRASSTGWARTYSSSRHASIAAS